MQNTTTNHAQKENGLTFFIPSALGRMLWLFLVVTTVPTTGIAQNDKAIQPCPAASHNIKAGSGVVATTPQVNSNVSQTVVDAGIADDPDLLRIIKPYSARVRVLDSVIGTLEGDLVKTGIGGGSMGNFVTDGLRSEASRSMRKPVPLFISNSGGLRKNSIAAGKLRVRDIFELLPFENSIIQLDLTGEQVLNLLAAVVASRDAQSGARINFRTGQNNRPEFVSATFVDAKGRETPIDPKTVYTIATIDYLYEVSSGRYSILREAKNVKPLAMTLRESLLRFVRTQTAAGRRVRAKLDGRFTDVNQNATDKATPQ